MANVPLALLIVMAVGSQKFCNVEPMGILRHTQGRGDIKAHPKGAQLGAQQEGTNSVAISIQGMPFGHHAMLLPIFLFPWSMRWCV